MNKEYKIEEISIDDSKYPENLRNIYNPPKILYCIGNISLLNSKNKIAIIGCRDYSEYGRKVALKFSSELAKKDFVIISGCAKGIDSFSHIGCLKARGETIAVLGNGLDYVYPKENRKLEEEILNNNGLIISEYKLGIKPSKYTFPKRNRIISGLSNGVLVIEAKEKSGTLITVDFALDQGKNVYVIPGDITRENTKGTNELIKEGAKIITNVDDILNDLI